MINGFISANREAVLKLTVFSSAELPKEVDAVIDTGFNEYVTLTPEQISEFGLIRRAYIHASLGDGNFVSLPVYTIDILWHGQLRSVDVLETNNEPLIGLALLYGSRVLLDVVDGGSVAVSPLS